MSAMATMATPTLPIPATSSRTMTSVPSLPPSLTNTFPQPKLFFQGAEALLYRTTFLSATSVASTSDNETDALATTPEFPGLPAALKLRPPKAYRHPTLDTRLTRHRILQETRILVRLRREGLPVPAVYALDWNDGWFTMEWIDGCSVREAMDTLLGDWLAASANGEAADGALWSLMARLGCLIARMHDKGCVHGDLTTSNIMLRRPDTQPEFKNDEQSRDTVGVARVVELVEAGEPVLIDFGLASQSVQDEDRAVDLYVLERAFGSTHPQTEKLFQELLRAYAEAYKSGKQVLKRFQDVRMRGRKKIMIG